MALLHFTLLLVFLTECCGETHFIYKTQDKEEKLECETNKWQISTNSNNSIDLNCSVQCEPGESVDLNDDLKKRFCSKDKDSQSSPDCSLEVEKNESGESDDDDLVEKCRKDKDSQSIHGCSLEVKKSGFYSCVKSLDPGRFLFPFKSRPNNTIQSYIIAVQNPALTLESGRRSSSSVDVAEGGSVTLNCSFSFTKKYDGKQFTVYWIKTVNQNSTCIYSYDGDGLNHHCDEQKKMGARLLNLNTGQFTHNITISEVKRSDRGQYRCALQMDTSVKESKSAVNWKVIEDVTLSVRNPTPPHSTDQPETPETPDTPKTPGGLPVAVYAGVSVLLFVLLVGVAVFIRKRRFLSAGCQTVLQQRNQEDALDADCSPYAVGRGDHQYESIKSPSRTADPDHKQPSELLDPYSVVQLNDLYDSSATENVQHPD